MASLGSVAILGYNRSDELARAIHSALAPNHWELELVVSEDASQERRVAEVAVQLASKDTRVRFTGQERNLWHMAYYRRAGRAGTSCGFPRTITSTRGMS